MSIFRQIGAVAAMNFKNIPRRLGTSLVIVVGIAGVVAVLISVLAMSLGLIQTMSGNARSDRALVMTKNVVAAVLSAIPRDAVPDIMDAPGVMRGNSGIPMASPIAAVLLELPTAGGVMGSVQLRGVAGGFFGVRPEIRITEGRMFEPAVRELIVGKSALRHFAGLALGSKISFRDSDWTITGVFEAGGDAVESELLGDADTVMSAFRREVYQEVRVLLESAAAFEEFRAALAANPALYVDVKRESEYLAQQSANLTGLLTIVAYVVGTIMAVGAVFAALNTMYSAVSTRVQEIATLRALGFGGGAVAISVMLEALLLALLGGILGAAAAWLFFDGNQFSSTFGGVFQIGAVFLVTPALAISGIIWALVIGLIGGLFPAIRAARLPVAAALKAR